MCDQNPSCKFPQGRKCPTHSLSPEQLSRRNRQAALSAMANNPQAYREKCRKGYREAIRRHPNMRDIAISNGEKNNLSGLMLRVIELIKAEGKEVRVGVFYPGTTPVDLWVVECNLFVEVDGWRSARNAWGNGEEFMREARARLREKIRTVRAAGHRIHLYCGHLDQAREDERLRKELRNGHCKQIQGQ